MEMETEDLYVANSGIPYTGKGLFTREDIKKGTLIIEYTGDITTWDEVKQDADNAYIYFVNEDHVINAKNRPEAIARYANDAHGLTKVRGLTNNSRFVNKEGKVFIKATKDIPAGSEILVSYGKDYWETVRKNRELKKSTEFNKKET